MDSIKHIYGLIVTLIAVLMSACSQDEAIGVASTETIPIELNIRDYKVFSRAPGDVASSVNRILILPFRKTNEGLTNDDANFIPVYGSAKQIDVATFPNVVTKFTLTPAITYKILIIGYNRNDFDFTNQSNPSRSFSIGSVTTPVTLANFHLQPMLPTVVPEFFTCISEGHMKGKLIGTSFKPEQVNSIKGTLKRIVSGFTLDITNIPAYVTSISLTAEQLVTASRATDGIPTLWQTAGDASSKLIGSRTPIAGKVKFNQYILAIPDARKTLFYLDVTYVGITQRITMQITNEPNVVSGNRITFSSNHWVKITGNFTNSGLVFILSGTINLDDNAWDGII